MKTCLLGPLCCEHDFSHVTSGDFKPNVVNIVQNGNNQCHIRNQDHKKVNNMSSSGTEQVVLEVRFLVHFVPRNVWARGKRILVVKDCTRFMDDSRCFCVC